jgi:sirohydrochlorin cobaltochelatase
MSAGISVLLVSHGSSEDREAYSAVEALAQVFEREEGVEARVAFHKQAPFLEGAMDGLVGEAVVVVPYLFSAGYFASQVVPKKLGLEGIEPFEVRRVAGRSVVYTEPVGTDPQTFEILREVARTESRGRASSEAVLVIGHGTPRHGASSEAVHRAVEALDRWGGFGQVLAGFVDEEPSVEQALRRVTLKEVVVVPYFVANGPHVKEDIPEALGLGADRWENPHRVGDLVVWYVSALGLREEMLGVVKRQVTRGRRVLEEAVRKGRRGE